MLVRGVQRVLQLAVPCEELKVVLAHRLAGSGLGDSPDDDRSRGRPPMLSASSGKMLSLACGSAFSCSTGERFKSRPSRSEMRFRCSFHSTKGVNALESSSNAVIVRLAKDDVDTDTAVRTTVGVVLALPP